ncbi:MdtA/MuxA family multidrug efflux RND transporter periplasmic adaptor subunit [Bosea sp. 2KB_26]|uniref:MdtA/MuxA family multidrug efflux RND transporter periplasmic adaptor subunit n=1 Tax=Bosea sp. 2KB_26 TaxID=3237475 RepID=UPI003F927157
MNLKPEFPVAAPIADRPVANPSRTRRGGKVVLMLVLIAAGLGSWWWLRPGAEQPTSRVRTAPTTSVVSAQANHGDIAINIDALGTVTALATVTVRSQISGQLVRVNFKEGQDVKKGDLLAEIDSRPYEATLAQMKGQLARDEALLKGAQVDLARYQGLSAQNAVPHQTLDTQVALVAQYQGTLAADRAQVMAAEVNLQYTRIVAPLDGRVGLRQVDAGNYVTAGDANGIVVITQLAPISVLFTVPEDNLQAIAARLRDGAALPVQAFDRAGTKGLAEGTLQTFDSQIDPTTGTIKLRALFGNGTRALYPNQFVNIRLLLDTRKGVTQIPSAGVQRGVPGTFVYLVNADSTVSVRKVELGVSDGDHVEVVSGLKPGDTIVIDGADKLRDGARVSTRAPGGQTGTQPAAPPAGGNRRSAGGSPT